MNLDIFLVGGIPTPLILPYSTSMAENVVDFVLWIFQQRDFHMRDLSRKWSNSYGNPLTEIWLVVYLPLWKIWVCQLGWWNSHILWNKKNVWNHQPGNGDCMGLISNSTNNFALRWECHGDKAYLHLFTLTGLRKMVVKLYPYIIWRFPKSWGYP